MAKRRYSSVKSARSADQFSGYAERKRQEREAGSMISEDKNAIANLPQDVMIKAYPKVSYESYDLIDTIASADNQMNSDVRGGKDKTGKKFPEKY